MVVYFLVIQRKKENAAYCTHVEYITSILGPPGP